MSEVKNQKKFGLYFISMMTAFGLGNIWRFPYLVYDYGAGSFLLLFTLLSFFIGVPLIVSEVLLGKSFAERDYDSSSRILKNIFYKTNFPVLWWLPSAISLFVLSYYTIISCWILHYVTQLFYASVMNSGFETAKIYSDLVRSPFLQILLYSVHLLMTYLILNKGQKLKFNSWIVAFIPMLAVLIFYISYNYFSEEDIYETSKKLLYPNFFEIKKESLNYALGHMLFTLSLGFGTLISFGKKMLPETSTTTASSRLGLADIGISIGIVFLLFPMVLSIGYSGQGSEILFYVVPGYFAEEGLSLFMGFLFYFLVYICSLTASLGLAEGISSNIYESRNLSKNQTNFITCSLSFVLSVFFLILSFIPRSVTSIQNRGSVVFIDDILINFILPLAVILISRASLKHLDKDFVKAQFTLNEGPSTWKFYIYWKFVIKIGFPLLFIFSLILRFL